MDHFQISDPKFIKLRCEEINKANKPLVYLELESIQQFNKRIATSLLSSYLPETRHL